MRSIISMEQRFGLKSLALFALLVLILVPAAMAYSVGQGQDDWWINYPEGHSQADNPVPHPPWVRNALEKGPVLIYVHLGCDYCLPQTDAVEAVKADLGSEISIFDISGDGSDYRAVDATAYDPNGGSKRVPLTVILTLVKDSDGEVQLVWHSSEEVTGEDWIRDYVEDALSKYEQNLGT